MSEYNRPLQAKAYSVASPRQRIETRAASFDPAGFQQYRPPVVLDMSAYVVLVCWLYRMVEHGIE
jgi:hypothetical protein